MFDIKDIDKVKKGDILIVKDYNALEAVGSEISCEIKDVINWNVEDSFLYYGFEFDYSLETEDGEEEIEFLLLFRKTDNSDEHDVRLFRKWESDLKINFDNYITLFEYKEEDEDYHFVDFSLVHCGEEEDGALNYKIKSPFPFWQVSKRSTQENDNVSICEYQAVGEDLPDTYWAKNAFAEWYSFVDDEEMGLVTLWFGWDITVSDVDILKK